MIYPDKPMFKESIDKEELEKSENWGTLGAHDPSIFNDNGVYYVFSTDARVGGAAKQSIQVRKSKDLINWEYIGTALSDIPKEAKEWTGAEGIWAPELIKINNEYYLYYCASTFGKNRSCIGLLKSDSIYGPWKDCGIVIKTEENDNRNAIDPNLICDENGELWMAYGSFWSGIYLVALNKRSGKIKKSDDIGIRIAGRHYSTEGAIEGPYIIYNKDQGKYYLFVSYDSLGSDYNIRVGRSQNIYGPYKDINGVEMTDTTVINPNHVGNKIAGEYRFGNKEGWIAPGHNSVLNINEEYFVVHHIRREYNPSWFYMNVRRILWSDDGWPMMLPEKYAGEFEQKIDEEELSGLWEFITLYRDVNRVMVSKIYKFGEGNQISGENNGRWFFEDINKIKIRILMEEEVDEYKGKIIPAWDWEENIPTLVFTAINKNGVALWGKRIYK